MSQAQRDAIPAPADALMIFNTTTSEFNFWDPSTTSWEVFISSSIETVGPCGIRAA